MSAKTQFRLSAVDLEVVLALVRTGKLAEAGERLALDASTVFRIIQKMEKGLGQRLFERSRTGYQANELAQELAVHAEQMEAQLEAARSAMQMQPDQARCRHCHTGKQAATAAFDRQASGAYTGSFICRQDHQDKAL